MITFQKYATFLEGLRAQGVHSRPIRTVKDAAPAPGDLFLKHDVESKVDRAVKMAEVEASLDHYATYYFQGDLLHSTAGRDGAKKIAALGHEVTYHFDVLDANDGDWTKAQAEFSDYLEKFADIDCPVETVCPHGNPTKTRSGWRSNKDFFRSPTIRAAYPDMLDIVIDFPDQFPQGIYISDAGFRLRVIQDIAGNDKSNTAAMNDGIVLSWSNVLDTLRGQSGTVISLHPHRFTHSTFQILVQKYGFKALKSAYLLVRRVPFVPMLASKFYHLTRRF